MTINSHPACIVEETSFPKQPLRSRWLFSNSREIFRTMRSGCTDGVPSIGGVAAQAHGACTLRAGSIWAVRVERGLLIASLPVVSPSAALAPAGRVESALERLATLT